MEANIISESPTANLQIENHVTTQCQPSSTNIVIEGKNVKITFDEFVVYKEINNTEIQILMLKGEKGDPGGGGGVSDYDDLTNRPQINGVTLTSNKSFSDLGLERITDSEIEDIMS